LEVYITQEQISDRTIKDSNKLLVIRVFAQKYFDEEYIEYFKTTNKTRYLCVHQSFQEDIGMKRESYVCSVKEVQSAILDCMKNTFITRYPRLENKRKELQCGTIELKKENYIDNPKEFGEDIIVEVSDSIYMCIKAPDFNQFSEEFRQILETMKKKEPVTIYF